MATGEINSLILEKLEKSKCDENSKELIRNLLEFERDSLNEDSSRYTDQYKKFVEYYSRRKKK
jgi:hypothetical protein